MRKQYQDPEFKMIFFEESVKTTIYKSSGDGNDDNVDWDDLWNH